ncbi:hypothetical protein CKO31_09205 [Thiohalocapsa halophila]|uniref:Uncharacterized protein n=1 Tax=Thiohalocapsa halophila TaxID=69359 RepID=A0ABS1CG79_9GAMM|nr:hypothetical protein [Thiohalocapsa halophila]
MRIQTQSAHRPRSVHRLGGGVGRLRPAAVRHDPEPAPARRFGLQRAWREVAPPCFRALTSHPECRCRPASAPGRGARLSGRLGFPIRYPWRAPSCSTRSAPEGARRCGRFGRAAYCMRLHEDVRLNNALFADS